MRIVPTLIVARDTGVIGAASAFAGGQTGQQAAEYINPPTVGTVVSVAFTKLMRGMIGPLPIVKIEGIEITLI